jgi:hypothetical protein
VSLFFYLGGTITTPISDIGEGDIRLSMPPISETALALTPSMSGLTLDDPTGSLDVTPLRAFAIEEADCAKRRLFSGYVADRSQARGDGAHGSLILGAARTWDTTLVDYNNTMWQRVIRGSDGNRPAETDVARINWIIGSAYTATVSDAGLISSSGPVNMDATDYRGRYPADVAADCGNASQKNYFVYFDEATWHPAFAYFDPTSTIYTSTLQFSNVLSDVDSSTTFAATGVLDLDPSAVYSGVYLRYAGGTVYRQNTTTLSDIGIRDASIDEPDIKTSAAAIARADAYLVAAGVEQKTLKIHTELPSTHVNLILPGQRVRVKFSHLTGYTSYAYARVVTRTVSQAEGSDKVYIVELECRNPKLMGGIGAGGTPVSAGTGNNAVPPVGQPVVIATCADKPATAEAVATHDIVVTHGDPDPAANFNGWSTTAYHPTPGNWLTAQMIVNTESSGSTALVGLANGLVYDGGWCCTLGFGEPGTLYVGPGAGLTDSDEVCLLKWTDGGVPNTWHAWPANGTSTAASGFSGGRDAAFGLIGAGHFADGATGSFTVRIREYSNIGPAGAPAFGQPSGEQTPTPAPDGVTTTFTTPAKFRSGTLRVEVDGIDVTDDVTSSTANTFTLSWAPDSAAKIRVWYQGDGSGA